MIYALYILAILSILGMLFIWMDYHYQIRTSRLVLRQSLREATKSVLLKQNLDLQTGESVSFKEFPNMKFDISSDYWGLYEKLTVIGYSADLKEQYTALVGYEINQGRMPALYFLNGEPLKVSGKTSIAPNAYLTKAGVQKAYINSNNIGGSDLVDGHVFDIPFRKNTFFQNLAFKKKLRQRVQKLSTTSSERVHLDSNYYQSFDQSALILEMYEDSIFRGGLQGNIVLRSKQTIVLQESNKIHQAIIQAPKIVIRSGFQGDIHLIAEQIVLQQEVQLTYPSSIYVNSSNQVLVPFSSLGQGTMEGIAYFKNSNNTSKLENEVMFHENFLYQGQIFNENLQMNLSGTVWGSVMTNKLFYKNATSIHSNLLYNVEINRLKIRKEIFGASLPNFKSTKKIVKWIDHQSF